MTDQSDDQSVDLAGSATPSPAANAPKSLSRRALLAGASAAVPTVLTLGSGAAMAASSFGVSASKTPQQVGDNFVCLDPEGQPGPRYYYDGTAKATAVTANRWFVSSAELELKLERKHWDNEAKIKTALESVPKYSGSQLCIDGRKYIALETQNSPRLDSFRRPIMTEVQVTPSPMMSSNTYNSMDAAGKLTTTMLRI